MKRFPMVAALIALAAFSFAQERFLVVTRANTPEAVQAAMLAANPLPNGEGVTPSGAVASFVDSGEVLRVSGANIGALWPDGQPAPFAWFVAREDDRGIFSLTYGGPRAVVIEGIEQRLIIDGVLHRIGSAQIGGDAPALTGDRWNIGLHRAPPPALAADREVEIPTAAKARVARADPGREQEAEFGVLAGRNLDARIVVWDGQHAGGRGRWENLTLRVLLAGIYEEADTNTRYFALKETDTFVAADFLAGAVLTGLDTGVAAPDVTSIAIARLAVAVPVGVPFDYISAGLRNGGYRSFTRSVFTEAPVDTIDVDGVSVNVHLSHRRQSTLIFSAGVNIYFDRDSTNP